MSDTRKPLFRNAVMAVLTWFAADAMAGVAILGIALLALRQHRHLTPQQIVEVLPGDFMFVVATTTVAALVAMSVLWRYGERLNHPFAAFFPAVPGRTQVLALASAVIVMAIELGIETGVKQGLGIPLPISVSEAAINPKTWTEFGIVLVCLAGIVPLFEEVLFRGYIFGWLNRVLPLWPAITISAAMFAAVHGLTATRGGFSGWFGTGEIFGIGILLAWLAHRTGSLRPAVVAHAAINAVSFALGFFWPALYP